MRETTARETLTVLTGVSDTATIDRWIQIAKQIGSSWPTERINVLRVGMYDEGWRIVIE